MDRTRVKTKSFISRNRQHLTFNIRWGDWLKEEGIWIIVGDKYSVKLREERGTRDANFSQTEEK